MNLVSSARAEFEPLRSLGFALIQNTYVAGDALGLPLANPVRLLKITNITDATLCISFDGINDHDIVGAYSVCLYDFCSDKSDAAGLLELPAGKRIYVRHPGVNPTTGSVYGTVVYASQA